MTAWALPPFSGALSSGFVAVQLLRNLTCKQASQLPACMLTMTASMPAWFYRAWLGFKLQWGCLSSFNCSNKCIPGLHSLEARLACDSHA